MAKLSVCPSFRLSVCHKHALMALRKNGDSQEHQTFFRNIPVGKM